jgi:PPM family protein phosphatase
MDEIIQSDARSLEMQNLLQKYKNRISRWLARGYRDFGSLMTDLGSLATCTGEVRKENQDRALIATYSGYTTNDSFSVWILCDGIGGLKEGDAAAGEAIASILIGLISIGDLKKPGAIQSVIQETNHQIYDRFKEQGGCTLSIVLNSGSFSQAINIGDSRIYRKNENDKVISQLTTDDTVGNQLRLLTGNNVNMTGGLFNHHLSQYLGMGGELNLGLAQQFKLPSLENIILTSDGAHSIEKKVFNAIITSAPSPLETARRLVYVSKWSGGKDNASVICIPAKLPIKSDFELGLLKIWDCFGGLELFIDRSSLQLPSKANRPQVFRLETKNNLLNEDYKTSVDQFESEASKQPRRKVRKKVSKPSPEVEIIENIEDSAS